MKKTYQKLKGYFGAHSRADVWILVTGLAIFAVLGLWHASQPSIWFDEAFSAYLAQFNFADIARFTAADVHPPLYYWLLHIWQSLFGQSELAYRSMSLLFGGVAIVFTYLLTRKWFGRKAAAVSLLLLILSPMLVRYSQETRMYTMSAAIVMAATYVLTFAVETKKKLPWIIYGILIALGMLTHYFAALAWLAHWAWRAIVTWQTGKRGWAYLKSFFSREWIIAYGLAILIYAPWALVMLQQFTVVQNGFWIGPVTADSPLNYLTNLFYYQEHWNVKDWWALLLIAIVVVIVVVSIKAYRALNKKGRTHYTLIISLAVVPVLLLMAMTVPGNNSSFFVERYLMPAAVAASPLIGVGIAVGLAKSRRIWMVAVLGILITGMVYGLNNVYYYGNYNKNSDMHVLTKELVQLIDQRAEPGQPIVASSPWIFYEAVFYDSAEHPVYFIDANTRYDYGSLEMLKQNDDHKIKDWTAFNAEHPVIWYIGNTSEPDVPPFESSWQKIQTVAAYDTIDGKAVYRGTEYLVNAE